MLDAGSWMLDTDVVRALEVDVGTSEHPRAALTAIL
jgi:hypothetical protein